MGIRRLVASVVAFSGIVMSGSAVAENHHWQGFYVGAHLGGGAVDTDYSHLDGMHSDFTIDANGVIGGALAGFNWQRDSFVFGVEGDISFTNMDGAWADMPDHVKDVNWLATLRGRVGVLVKPNALVFATVGVAVLDEEFAHVGHHTWSETFTGWVAGGGADFALRNNLRLGVEALATGFGEETDFHPHDLGTHGIMAEPSGFVVRGRLTIPLNG